MAKKTEDADRVFGELAEAIRPRLADLDQRLASAKEYL
jgi:hypothetical protein